MSDRTNLIDFLRWYADSNTLTVANRNALLAAADEIERLHKENVRLTIKLMTATL